MGTVFESDATLLNMSYCVMTKYCCHYYVCLWGRPLALDYGPRKLPKLELFLPKYKCFLAKYKCFLTRYNSFLLNTEVPS